MSARLTTVVGQFSIVNGIWKADAANQVAVRAPKAAGVMGAGKGDLFVLAEVRGAAGDRQALEKQMVEMFRDAYYMSRGSITASLRRAMQVVGSMLYDRNYTVGVEQRIIGGLVAVAVQGEDAFVAQIGPSACYAVLGGHVQRYPDRSVWLDENYRPDNQQAETALGLNILTTPNLHHLRVGPDDVLVLADSGLAATLHPDDVRTAVQGTDIKTAIKNLGGIVQSLDCSVMVLGVVKDHAADKHPLNAAVARLRQQADPLPEMAPVAMAEAEPPRARRTPSRPGKDRPRRPVGETVSQTTMFTDDTPEPAERERVMASTAASIPLRATAFRNSRTASQDVWKMMTQFIQRTGRAILLLLALLARGLQVLLRPLVGQSDEPPYRQAGMKVSRSRESAVPWKLLRNIAIAIPVLVAVIVGVSYLQKGRLQENEYRRLVDTAQTKVQQAAAADRNAAIALLAEANALLTQAEQIKADQPEISQMRQQIAVFADKLANVTRLPGLAPLRQYTDPGTDLGNIVIQGIDVYVLDRGNGRIFHHQLDDLGQSLLPDSETLLTVARGQEVDGVTVGDIIDMTWMPAGGNRQTSDLVILGSHGLMEYHPNWGIAMSALASQDRLLSPVAISSFFGNLYILDPAGNQLLRYLPTADGYSALPESYFPPEQPVELTNAVDFAIDGAVYVLFRDGRINKYLRGEPVPFTLTDLDRPLNNPTAIFTAPDEEVQYVYVVDAGNQRIVQLNKDGSFVRQFKPAPELEAPMANLQDVFVDELGGRIFIIAGNTLYAGNLPLLEQ